MKASRSIRPAPLRATLAAPPYDPRNSWDPWRFGEPSLAEIMADPIIHQVMAGDGMAPAQVWSVLEDARAALARRLCPVRLAA